MKKAATSHACAGFHPGSSRHSTTQSGIGCFFFRISDVDQRIPQSCKMKAYNIAIGLDSLSGPPCVLEFLDFLTLKMFCLKPPRSSILRLQLHVRLRHGVDREWDKVNHRCLDLLVTKNGLQFYPMVSDVF